MALDSVTKTVTETPLTMPGDYDDTQNVKIELRGPGGGVDGGGGEVCIWNSVNLPALASVYLDILDDTNENGGYTRMSLDAGETWHLIAYAGFGVAEGGGGGTGGGAGSTPTPDTDTAGANGSNGELGPRCIITYTVAEAPSAPTVQATNVVASNVTQTTATVSCTAGDGSARVIGLMTGASAGMANELVDNDTYAANPALDAGAPLGGSALKCIYNGASNTVNVTGLSPGTLYGMGAAEYSGAAGSERYMDDAAAGNPANFTTLGASVARRASGMLLGV